MRGARAGCVRCGEARDRDAWSPLRRGARQRRLRLVKSEPFGENGVVTAFATFDESRLQRNAPFSREIRRVTGAAQQPLHLTRPVFILDFDESLQFAKMMSVAQGVQHPLHRVVGLPEIGRAHV